MAGEMIFTLDEAKALLPEVIRITGHYRALVEERRYDLPAAAAQEDAERIEHEIRSLLNSWAVDISALGAEPKGLWLVDFDSGDGFYFCWQFGEDDVEHIHSYEGGFAARRKIEWSRE